MRALHQTHHSRKSQQIAREYPLGKVFMAGVLSTLLVTLIMGIGLLTGFTRLSFESLLGGLFTGQTNAVSWWLGFGWNLFVGGLFALVYAAIFRSIQGVNFFFGAALGLIHGLLVGLFFGLSPTVFGVPEYVQTYTGVPDAGFSAFTTFLFLLAHVAYGGSVGLACEKIRKVNRQEARRDFPHRPSPKRRKGAYAA